MAKLFDFRTRSRDRDRQTDEKRLAHLSSVLAELEAEIEKERAGLTKRLHSQSADAGFLSDALDNGELRTRNADRLQQLTAALTHGQLRIAELARQSELVETLRRTLNAATHDAQKRSIGG